MNFNRFATLVRSAKEVFPKDSPSEALYGLENYKRYNYTGADRDSVIAEILEARAIMRIGSRLLDRFPEFSEETIFWEALRERESQKRPN